MNLKNSKETLQAIKNIIDEKRGAYVRFGDSEIEIMANWETARTHFRHSKEMQDELRETFFIENKDWLVSIIPFLQEQGMGGNTFGYSGEDRIKELLWSVFPEDKKSDMDTRIFYNPIALHYLSLFEPELLINFIKDYIHPKITVIIGGDHLRKANKFFKNNYFYQTQGEDKTELYFQLDKLYPLIKNFIKAYNIEIILFGCGIATGIIQKRLWKDKVNTVTLDIGSLFDMMLRIQSRGWINDNHSLICNFEEKWSSLVS